MFLALNSGYKLPFLNIHRHLLMEQTLIDRLLFYFNFFSCKYLHVSRVSLVYMHTMYPFIFWMLFASVPIDLNNLSLNQNLNGWSVWWSRGNRSYLCLSFVNAHFSISYSIFNWWPYTVHIMYFVLCIYIRSRLCMIYVTLNDWKLNNIGKYFIQFYLCRSIQIFSYRVIALMAWQNMEFHLIQIVVDVSLHLLCLPLFRSVRQQFILNLVRFLGHICSKQIVVVVKNRIIAQSLEMVILSLYLVCCAIVIKIKMKPGNLINRISSKK